MTQLSKKIYQFIAAEQVQEIDQWIAKYPSDQKQSAVMAALTIVQDSQGYLSTESMTAVAEYLDMPVVSVFEVATFYDMYEHKPIGRHLIRICTNISCKLLDSDGIVKHLESRLGVRLGDTTSDGRFTLKKAECLGACVGAPMVQINKDYYEHLSPEKIDVILNQFE